MEPEASSIGERTPCYYRVRSRWGMARSTVLLWLNVDLSFHGIDAARATMSWFVSPERDAFDGLLAHYRRRFASKSTWRRWRKSASPLEVYVDADNHLCLTDGKHNLVCECPVLR